MSSRLLLPSKGMYSVWWCCSVDSLRHFKCYRLKLFLSISSPEHRPFAGEGEGGKAEKMGSERATETDLCPSAFCQRGE